MNRRAVAPTEAEPSRRGAALVVAAVTLSMVYCFALLVRPSASWPTHLRELIGALRRWLFGLIDAGYEILGIPQAATELRWSAYFLLTSALVPWAVLGVLRRGRPYDIGFRRPNRIGWRVVIVGCLLALPFQIWMVDSPTFDRQYLPQIERVGMLGFLLYYAVIILVEHFFFHGVLLGACRMGGRWPSPAAVAADADDPAGRILQWIGLCQPTDGTSGLRRLTRWAGLQDGCVPAIMISALLFAAVHLGKDPRELILSLPGGIALGYISYRTNTWLIPFLLHASTAGMACALMLLMR